MLEYVQVKPVLAAVTLILKACGKFNEGDFRANSGYLYVSIVYNTSICLSLYCLAVFWLCVNDDLTPFRSVIFSRTSIFILISIQNTAQSQSFSVLKESYSSRFGKQLVSPFWLLQVLSRNLAHIPTPSTSPLGLRIPSSVWRCLYLRLRTCMPFPIPITLIHTVPMLRACPCTTHSVTRLAC